MKPQLANDANLATLKYPLIVQPKIDGVRALNINGTLTGRSLDPLRVSVSPNTGANLSSGILTVK